MRKIWAIAVALLAAPAMATEDDLRSMTGMEHHNRVLLVFAPSLDDPRLKLQRREIDHAALAMSERDLLLVQVAGSQVIGAHDAADKLRQRFRVRTGDYTTLLVGKDGVVAMHVVGPISARHLEQRIDAMPMRQDEIRRAHEGRATKGG